MLKYIKYMWIHVFKGWKLIEKWFVLMCKMWKLRYFGGCKAWTVIEALGTTGSQVTSLGSDSQKCVIVARRARGELRELAKWSGHVVPSSVQVQNQNLSFLTWFHMVWHRQGSATYGDARSPKVVMVEWLNPWWNDARVMEIWWLEKLTSWQPGSLSSNMS
jgi:hypothetical protein